MRKPTQEEIDDFIKYRANHVALVQKLGKVALDMDFSSHDSDKINAVGKELDLFAMRNASKKSDLNLSKEEINELRKVSARHAKSNKHHPEYWDPNITTRNFKADDTNIIYATKMPKRDLAEMACDWSSCALCHNEPILDWYNKVVDKTLFLTDNQKSFLLECLKKIEKAIKAKNIAFPDVEYTAEQVEELKEELYGIVNRGTLLEGTVRNNLEEVKELRKDLANKFKETFEIRKLSAEEKSIPFTLTEKIVKEGSKWKVVSEDGSRSFGTYNTKKEAEKRLKQIHYFKHINESILDIPQKEYYSGVLTESDEMQPEIRDQILETIKAWKDLIDFDFKVLGVEAKGSLLSKRYNDTSDLDVSIYTNMTEEQLSDIFNAIPKGRNLIVNGEETNHPLDFFVIPDSKRTIEYNLDNIYDVLNNKWIKRTPEYENEIPLDYMLQVCNFFIDGCAIALNNYENDKILFTYYKQISPASQEVHEDELRDIIEDKKRDLQADLDALRMALHMVTSFRQEGYKDEDGESNPFYLSLEIKSDNPHNTINEQLAKILEKFNIRQRLRDAVRECSSLLNDNLQEEVSAGAFAGMVPENVLKVQKKLI